MPIITAPEAVYFSRVAVQFGNIWGFAEMGFESEPQSYSKTAISDLQGAWQCLRSEVVDNFGFDDSDKLLFHIDEAMSWESVRNLKKMKASMLIVSNIIVQSDSPGDIPELLQSVREHFEDAVLAIKEGEAK